MERETGCEDEGPQFLGANKNSGVYRRHMAPEALRRSDTHERRARLAGVVASEIVPRLLFLHHRTPGAGVAIGPPGPDEVAEFGSLVMGPDIAPASVYFEGMRAKGHSLDSLFVNFLAPTARHLGELWEQDRCDFIDVTIGVARLQEILDLFGSPTENQAAGAGHRVLLATTVAEKHLFGVDMVAKFMRAAGWDTAVQCHLSPKDSAELVARERFGVFGMTLSASSGLDAVAATIEAVRRASRNPSIGVVVGGPAFAGRPGLAVQVGADAAAIDAPTAVVLARKLLVACAPRP
ncbi:MAG: cobalamin B12-binding domain-containing protein [Roseiarcus sp.]|jgi:methanogenic corrinoid protein MtbC1